MLHLVLLLFGLWFEPCCYGFLPHLQPLECGLRRFHSSDWVLELDLIYSHPRRSSLSIGLDELAYFRNFCLFTCHGVDFPRWIVLPFCSQNFRHFVYGTFMACLLNLHLINWYLFVCNLHSWVWRIHLWESCMFSRNLKSLNLLARCSPSLRRLLCFGLCYLLGCTLHTWVWQFCP